MKPNVTSLYLLLSMSMLAGGLSSCSLLKNGKLSSQWEIESDVPASLNSGHAAAPAGTVAGNTVRSNLSGEQPPAGSEGGSLDLPGSESGTMMEIPKPEFASDGTAYQSPPEMLSIPASEGVTDLPGNAPAPAGLTTLLPAPPPPVTEEELVMPPAALTPEAAAATTTAAAEWAVSTPSSAGRLGPLSGENASPIAHPTRALAATSIPLLYGKLDLTTFLTPAPMAAHTTPSVDAGP